MYNREHGSVDQVMFQVLQGLCKFKMWSIVCRLALDFKRHNYHASITFFVKKTYDYTRKLHQCSGLSMYNVNVCNMFTNIKSKINIKLHVHFDLHAMSLM